MQAKVTKQGAFVVVESKKRGDLNLVFFKATEVAGLRTIDMYDDEGLRVVVDRHGHMAIIIHSDDAVLTVRDIGAVMENIL